MVNIAKELEFLARDFDTLKLKFRMMATFIPKNSQGMEVEVELKTYIVRFSSLLLSLDQLLNRFLFSELKAGFCKSHSDISNPLESIIEVEMDFWKNYEGVDLYKFTFSSDISFISTRFNSIQKFKYGSK